MNKSIIFLIGSLVTLLPFVPNTNIFSNVMGFDDYGYDTDQYMKYAEDMVNENHYKSKDSNLLIQKIKCNNINNNLNGVDITIGTSDPIGLGTASLQQGEDSANPYGYSASNGNDNFDLDCINTNNNTGGGPDEQKDVFDATNVYQVFGNITDTELTKQTSTVAFCDSGDIVLEGGYQLTDDSLTPTDRTTFAGSITIPGSTTPSSAYKMTVTSELDDTPFVGDWQAFAFCFDNPPLRP